MEVQITFDGTRSVPATLGEHCMVYRGSPTPSNRRRPEFSGAFDADGDAVQVSTPTAGMIRVIPSPQAEPRCGLTGVNSSRGMAASNRQCVLSPPTATNQRGFQLASCQHDSAVQPR